MTDFQVPTGFDDFVKLAADLEQYAPTRVQISEATWRVLHQIVTDPTLPWPYSTKVPIFGIPLVGVEMVPDVPDGIIRLPELDLEKGGR